MNLIAGIDPGKTGAIALLDPDGEIIHLEDMPDHSDDWGPAALIPGSNRGRGGRHQPVPVSAPAPTLAFGNDYNSWRWVPAVDRRQQTDGIPSRLVPVTEPAPTLDTQTGWKWVIRNTPCERSPGLTAREALTLQGFPAAYPVQGSKRKKFEQIGNAVPPTGQRWTHSNEQPTETKETKPHENRL